MYDVLPLEDVAKVEMVLKTNNATSWLLDTLPLPRLELTNELFSLPKYLLSTLNKTNEALLQLREVHNLEYRRERILPNIKKLRLQRDALMRHLSNISPLADDLYTGITKFSKDTTYSDWDFPRNFNYVTRVFFFPCCVSRERGGATLLNHDALPISVACDRALSGLRKNPRWAELGEHQGITCFGRGKVLIQIIANEESFPEYYPESAREQSRRLYGVACSRYSWQAKAGGDILVMAPEIPFVRKDQVEMVKQSCATAANTHLRAYPGRCFQQVVLTSLKHSQLEADACIATEVSPLNYKSGKFTLLSPEHSKTIGDEIARLTNMFVKAHPLGGPRNIFGVKLAQVESLKALEKANPEKQILPKSMFKNDTVGGDSSFLSCEYDSTRHEVVYYPGKLVPPGWVRGMYVRFEGTTVPLRRVHVPFPLHIIVECLLNGCKVPRTKDFTGEKSAVPGFAHLSNLHHMAATDLSAGIHLKMLTNLGVIDTALAAVSKKMRNLANKHKYVLKEHRAQVDAKFDPQLRQAQEAVIVAKDGRNRAKLKAAKYKHKKLMAKKKNMEKELGLRKPDFYREFEVQSMHVFSAIDECDDRRGSYTSFVDDLISNEELLKKACTSLKYARIFKDEKMRDQPNGPRTLILHSNFIPIHDAQPSRWRSVKLLSDAAGIVSELLIKGIGKLSAFSDTAEMNRTKVKEIVHIDLRGHRIQCFPVEFNAKNCDIAQQKLFELQHLKNLKVLQLSHNIIESMATICNRSLQVLNLSFNKLRRLPLLHLENLRILNASNNLLSGRLDLALGLVEHASNRPRKEEGDAAAYMEMLTLDISGNLFDWNDMQTQYGASMIGVRMPNLQNLMMHNNPFITRITTTEDIFELRSLFALHLFNLLAFSPPHLPQSFSKEYEDTSVALDVSPWHQYEGNKRNRWHGVYLGCRPDLYENSHASSLFEETRGKYEKSCGEGTNLSHAKFCVEYEMSVVENFASMQMRTKIQELGSEFDRWKVLHSHDFDAAFSPHIPSKHRASVAHELDDSLSERMVWRLVEMYRESCRMSVRRGFFVWKNFARNTSGHKSLQYQLMDQKLRYLKRLKSKLNWFKMYAKQKSKSIPAKSVYAAGLFKKMEQSLFKVDRESHFRYLMYRYHTRRAFTRFKEFFTKAALAHQRLEVKRIKEETWKKKKQVAALKLKMEKAMADMAAKFTVEDELLLTQEAKLAQLEALRRDVALKRLYANQLTFKIDRLKEENATTKEKMKTMLGAAAVDEIYAQL
jgi:hypothetical protein